MNDKESVTAEFPCAKELPLAGDPPRIWIVTGTGYRLGCATTPEKAWHESVKLLQNRTTFPT